MPTDLFKKVKIFRLPTGSQTDLPEMVKNFRYPLGSQLNFLIKEVKSFRYLQGLQVVTGGYAIALAFGDCANTHTSYLSFLLHWQDFRKPNFTPKKND